MTAAASVKISHLPRARAMAGAAALVTDAEGLLRRVLHFNYPKGCELIVIFVPEYRTPAPLTRKGLQWYLECHGHDLERFCSDKELNRLFSAMTAAGYGLSMPARTDFLPAWVTAAFREQLQASKAREQVFRGNRSALSFGALLERPSGVDFRGILRMNPGKLSPSEEKLHRETARMTLDVAASRHLLRPLLTRCAAGDAENAMAEFERAFAAAQKEKEFNAAMLKAGRAWMWREIFPRPAEQLRRELQEFRSAFPLPELDDAGKPTGKQQVLSLKQAMPLLAQRSDGQQLARKALQRLHELSQQDGRWSRIHFLEATQLVASLLKIPEKSAEFEAYLDRMDAQFRQRQKTEEFLSLEEQKHAPARMFFRYSLAEAAAPSAAETPELVRWLEAQSR